MLRKYLRFCTREMKSHEKIFHAYTNEKSNWIINEHVSINFF